MAYEKFTELAVRLYYALAKKKVHADMVILFGSHATGNTHSDSDIDFAVVSRDFGKDRIMEGALCNLLASDIDARIEVVPIGLDAYFDRNSISPILHEVKKTGICLI